jgi:hypothetical protein
MSDSVYYVAAIVVVLIILFFMSSGSKQPVSNNTNNNNTFNPNNSKCNSSVKPKTVPRNVLISDIINI